MQIVDTNIILRFLLDDNQAMSSRAADIIIHNEIFLLEEVLAEVVYVLEKVYKLSKIDLVNIIQEFISYTNIIVDNKDVIDLALNTYKQNNLDFVDCILYSYSKCRNATIYTFDRKLEKCINNDLSWMP
jgi:predicted nucleic-acid-binding protein